MSNIELIVFVFLSLLSLSRPDFARHTKYIIVLNAENNRTAVTTFFFESVTGKNLEFLSLFQDEVTPGLSSYLYDTHGCIPGLKHLITRAQTMIPLSERPSTPVILIATTGLRYISEKGTNTLLETIREYFKKTGLRVDHNSVSLMVGRKKILSWLSVNLILGRLESKALEPVALINLGSRYSFVTYVPGWNSWLAFWEWKKLINVTAFGRNFEVFSHSYFGLGLNEARAQIFEQDKKKHSDVYVSACVHPLVNTTWTFDGKTYIIRGEGGVQSCCMYSKPVEVNIKACMRRVNAVFDKHPEGPTLDHNEVYATSFFYRTAVLAGMVEGGKNLNVTVDDIYGNATRACGYALRRDPFVCMDLLFVHTFLTRFYGITNETTVRLVSKLHGHEVNWPLGAAFRKYEEEVNGFSQIAQVPTFA